MPARSAPKGYVPKGRTPQSLWLLPSRGGREYIAGIANIFWGNSTMDLIVSAVGVIVFALFTAYDTQNILREGLYCEDEDQRRKGAILGALNLYLDFINLFLYLLRFLGRLKD